MAIQRISSFQNIDPQVGTLFLVPTPIGNLNDMTPRAVSTLKEADYIAAEDTRNTQKLLNHFDIHTKQISFHKYNTRERIPELIQILQSGKQIAQVSDAGMPSISDPGHELVEACINAQIPVVALPGPSASVTALIASGLVPQPFIFYGFLPRKRSEQLAELEKINHQTITMIFYEAPHRLYKTLKNLAKVFGNERRIVLARELTKRYEEYLRGTLADAVEWSAHNEIRGEFVLVVAGNPCPPINDIPTVQRSMGTIKEQVQQLIDNQGLKPNTAIKRVAKENNLKKQDVYNQFHELGEYK